jgi:hypothetical protein
MITFFWALLFFLSGGFGYIFALAITPTFRTWNRLHIILITISFLVLAHLLSEALKLLHNQKRPLIVLLTIVIVSLQAQQIEQTKEQLVEMEPDKTSLGLFNDLVHLSNTLDTHFKKGCQILQLPIMATPEGGNVGRVLNGNNYWMPLINNNLRFSFGAVKGTNAGDFWLQYNDSGSAIAKAVELNFCGLIVDTYSDDQKWQTVPEELEILFSTLNGRYIIYKLI